MSFWKRKGGERLCTLFHMFLNTNELPEAYPPWKRKWGDLTGRNEAHDLVGFEYATRQLPLLAEHSGKTYPLRSRSRLARYKIMGSYPAP